MSKTLTKPLYLRNLIQEHEKFLKKATKNSRYTHLTRNHQELALVLEGFCQVYQNYIKRYARFFTGEQKFAEDTNLFGALVSTSEYVVKHQAEVTAIGFDKKTGVPTIQSTGKLFDEIADIYFFFLESAKLSHINPESIPCRIFSVYCQYAMTKYNLDFNGCSLLTERDYDKKTHKLYEEAKYSRFTISEIGLLCDKSDKDISDDDKYKELIEDYETTITPPLKKVREELFSTPPELSAFYSGRSPTPVKAQLTNLKANIYLTGKYRFRPTNFITEDLGDDFNIAYKRLNEKSALYIPAEKNNSLQRDLCLAIGISTKSKLPKIFSKSLPLNILLALDKYRHDNRKSNPSKYVPLKNLLALL